MSSDLDRGTLNNAFFSWPLRLHTSMVGPLGHQPDSKIINFFVYIS